MKKYFYTDGVSKFGPFSMEELLDKNISQNTKIWFYGLTTWIPFDEVEELKEHLGKIPPPVKLPPPIHVAEPPVFDSHIIERVDRKPKSISKLFIIIPFIILVVLIIFMSIYYNQENSKEENYNEIVESAYESDEDFSMYLDKFYRDLNVFGIYPKSPTKVIIKFAKLDQMTDATHIHALSFGVDKDELIEIYINPSSWEKFNKPKRYFLMYHELAHDILNLDDLPAIEPNKGKLMFPYIESYELITMDDFIESYQECFEEFFEK